MNADQMSAALKQFITTITTWLKLVVGLALALIITATLFSLFGHAIPYVPGFKAGLQEVGILTACLAYWLKS